MDHSVRLALPRIIRPFALSLAATVESAGRTASCSAYEPATHSYYQTNDLLIQCWVCDELPLVCIRSRVPIFPLIRTGRPCKGLSMLVSNLYSWVQSTLRVLGALPA